MCSRMQEAKDMQIQVVPEDYFENAKAGGEISYITSNSICDWVSNPHAKFKSKKIIYTKSAPSKVTLKLKGGLAVDPESGVDEVAHVYKRKRLIFNFELNKVILKRRIATSRCNCWRRT
uniref:Poly [ADP-ribose] polymerase n=1 Tax=Culex pipiens TaxID=7175 RepID=A0A8D8FQY9_CULPI